MAVRKV